MARRSQHKKQTSAPAARAPEALLLEYVPKISASRLLCTSLGRAEFAVAWARQNPGSETFCHFLDLLQAQQAEAAVAGRADNLTIDCQADLPAGEFDAVVFPVLGGREADLTRDRLQTAHQLLVNEGMFIVATDAANDRWMTQELQKHFSRVTRVAHKRTVYYQARKTAPLKKVKTYDAEFAFRDGEHLFSMFSRPGVLGHRQLPLLLRALIDALEIQPGWRVLDLRCGIGAVGLAAANRADDVFVQSVDSNLRAVQCTGENFRRNELSRCEVSAHAGGSLEPAGSFDLVTLAPPFSANNELAALDLQTAWSALKPGGQLIIVTKHFEWFGEQLVPRFGNVTVDEIRGYFVVTGDGFQSSTPGW